MLDNNLSNTQTGIFAKEVKVRTLQYKLTIFIIALGLFVCRPFLTDAWNSYNSTRDQYDKLVTAYSQKKVEHDKVVSDLELLQKVNGDATKRAVIVQCYNTNCQSMQEELRVEPAKSTFKAFLQLQQATNTKFTIDQKKVLTYLNEFLIKNANSTPNGQIQAITFGLPQKTTTEGLIRIPMTLTASFNDKQGLLGFLRNIEQLISPTYPMLGVVQSVTYDIVKASESQDVNIAIDIYMLSQ